MLLLCVKSPKCNIMFVLCLILFCRWPSARTIRPCQTPLSKPYADNCQSPAARWTGPRSSVIRLEKRCTMLRMSKMFGLQYFLFFFFFKRNKHTGCPSVWQIQVWTKKGWIHRKLIIRGHKPPSCWRLLHWRSGWFPCLWESPMLPMDTLEASQPLNLYIVANLLYNFL